METQKTKCIREIITNWTDFYTNLILLILNTYTVSRIQLYKHHSFKITQSYIASKSSAKYVALTSFEKFKPKTI